MIRNGIAEGLVYGGFAILALYLLANSERPTPEKEAEMFSSNLEHYVTEYGLECVRYRDGSIFGISCNWDGVKRNLENKNEG